MISVELVNVLQSNRLVKIENLEGLVMLEQLYLSDNGIEVVEGLDTLVGTVAWTLAAALSLLAFDSLPVFVRTCILSYPLIGGWRVIFHMY